MMNLLSLECVEGRSLSKVVGGSEETSSALVQHLGQPLDSQGKLIRRTLVRFPTTLANKMQTVQEENTVDGSDGNDFIEQTTKGPILDTLDSALPVENEEGILDVEIEPEDDVFSQVTGDTSHPGSGESNVFQGTSNTILKTPETLRSPVTVLDDLAKEHGATVEYSTVEMDSGDMNQPIYYECTLQAGPFEAKQTSSVRKIAKMLAAQECLENMKRLNANVGLDVIPEWKHVKQVDSRLDPVFLLMNFCKTNQLIAPCYSYSYSNLATGEQSHFFKCFWNQSCTEGRGSTKELAQRRAAFEMLDYLMKNKSDQVKSTGSIDYMSIKDSSVQAVSAGLLEPENLIHATAPFEVSRHKRTRPDEPEIRVRHGLAKNGGDNLKYLRYTTEYEATFRCSGDTPEEAFEKCMASAKEHAQMLDAHVKESLANRRKITTNVP